MWTTEIVGLSYCFFHFQTVHDCKRNISDINWLYFGVHSFNLPVHSVEHFHLHAPFCCNGRILMEQIDYVRRSNNSNIRENCLDFLLTNPLGSQSS